MTIIVTNMVPTNHYATLKDVALIANSAAGTTSVASTVSTSSGGTRWTGWAIEKSALPTVPTHTAPVAGATPPNTGYALVAPVLTTEGVPYLVVAIGGVAGSPPTSTKKGALCGTPLNEVGSGMGLTVYVRVDMRKLAK